MAVTKLVKQAFLATALFATTLPAFAQRKAQPVKMPEDPRKEAMIARGQASRDFFFSDIPMKLDKDTLLNQVFQLNYSVPSVEKMGARVLFQQRILDAERDNTLTREDENANGILEEILELHEFREGRNGGVETHKMNLTKDYDTGGLVYKRWISIPNPGHREGVPNVKDSNPQWLVKPGSIYEKALDSTVSGKMDVFFLLRDAAKVTVRKGEKTYQVDKVMDYIDKFARTGQEPVMRDERSVEQLIKDNVISKKALENHDLTRLEPDYVIRGIQTDYDMILMSSYEPPAGGGKMISGKYFSDINQDGTMQKDEQAGALLALVSPSEAFKVTAEEIEGDSANYKVHVMRTAHDDNGKVLYEQHSDGIQKRNVVNSSLEFLKKEGGYLLKPDPIGRALNAAQTLFPPPKNAGVKVSDFLNQDHLKKQQPEPKGTGHDRFGKPNFNSRN